MTDPLWEEYVGAVHGLGQLPELHDERRREAAAEEAATVGRAREAAEAQFRSGEEWTGQARRALTTAEARLVAAQVLVPDEASALPPATGAPAALSKAVHQAEQELVTDLAGLQTARRRARENAIARAHRARELAARRRQIAIFAAVGAVVVLAILGLAIAFG